MKIIHPKLAIEARPCIPVAFITPPRQHWFQSNQNAIEKATKAGPAKAFVSGEMPYKPRISLRVAAIIRQVAKALTTANTTNSLAFEMLKSGRF